jgi:hypothetical protein
MISPFRFQSCVAAKEPQQSVATILVRGNQKSQDKREHQRNQQEPFQEPQSNPLDVDSEIT